MLKSFSILTLGCKVNQYESQQIRALLTTLGLRFVDVTEAPDLVVVNTCCVTHTASAKSRRCIRRARKHRPKAVVVCGCLPAVPTDEFKADRENIHVVKDRCQLATTLNFLVSAESTTPDSLRPVQCPDAAIRPEISPKVKCKKDLAPPQELPALTSFQGHTRAFLKIQDGCDSFCSYCIIPYTRPEVRSKRPDKVLAEAAALVAAGHKEIVLTGVHVGAYGRSTVRRRRSEGPEDEHLPGLLERVARIPDLPRIRLSSLDPVDVTERLLDVFAAHRNIMPHLHLSLQSGSDRVLGRMCRPYTADEFRAKVDLINSHLDRPAITTDIIVGFPSETDADFQQTVRLAREVAFAKMHVFTFSPRRGTAAAKMPDRVQSQIVKERSQILRDIDLELQSRFRERFLGETAQVLVETANGRPAGRAERYFMVYLNHSAPRPDNNDLVTVRIEQNARDGVIGSTL